MERIVLLANADRVSLVSFHRRELTQILSSYSRMLAFGLCKDYAIDHLHDRAAFCFFRRAGENALYRIEKTPHLATRQGVWALFATDGSVLKRGRELAHILRVLDIKIKRAARN